MGLMTNSQRLRAGEITEVLTSGQELDASEPLGSPPAGLGEKVLSPTWLASQPVSLVSIDSLAFDGSPRLGGEDPEHARLLAEASSPLPPIMVHQPTMRVIDGVHRVRAAQLKNRREIEARLLQCDENDAFVLAVKANVTHGLPLSREDRAAAAVRIITGQPQWSDRAVAAATGLSDKTVSRIRERIANQTPQPVSRIGRDGRVRPLDTATRRQQAAALISERPGTGLREIARATGLSAATVRDVRQRIDRGENPVPSRMRPAAQLERATSAMPRSQPILPRARWTRYKEPPADRQTLLAKLSNDPSLRFSEAGRHLLGWLHRHTVDADGLEKLCYGVPDHWAPVVAELARTCAAAWTGMADRLDQRITE